MNNEQKKAHEAFINEVCPAWNEVREMQKASEVWHKNNKAQTANAEQLKANNAFINEVCPAWSGVKDLQNLVEQQIKI